MAANFDKARAPPIAEVLRIRPNPVDARDTAKWGPETPDTRPGAERRDAEYAKAEVHNIARHGVRSAELNLAGTDTIAPPVDPEALGIHVWVGNNDTARMHMCFW